MAKEMEAMEVQQHCEVIEALLTRDATNKGRVLTHEEFAALNEVLLVCQVKLGYEVDESRIRR